MATWNLIPYVSIGSLNFGMNRDGVEGVLGRAALEEVDEDGVTWLYWGGNTTQCGFKAGELVLVSLYAGANDVEVHGISLSWSKSDEFFRDIIEFDPVVRECYGIYVFFSLGISVSGLLRGVSSEKSLTAFARGQWSIDDPMLKSVRI